MTDTDQESAREALARTLQLLLRDPEWVAALSRAASYEAERQEAEEGAFWLIPHRLREIQWDASGLWQMLERPETDR